MCLWLRGGGGGGALQRRLLQLRLKLLLLQLPAHRRVCHIVRRPVEARLNGSRTGRTFLRLRHLPRALSPACYVASLLRILQSARR